MDSSNSSSSHQYDKIILIINTTAAIFCSLFQYYSSDGLGSERKWGRSPQGKSPNIPWEFWGTHNMVCRHYFNGVDSL